MSEAEADPYLGRVIAQRYRLARCVGRGGMGAVYEATHVQTEKRVAVKILAPRLSRDLKLITRFRREAMAASRLDHESCVAVYDFGEDTDGTFYITMEYVDGTGLGQDIKRHGPMSAERCVHVGIQLLSALDAAHASGILHRDLKPQNIMLTRLAGRDDVVKVVDFGIAKFIDNTPEDQVALTIPGTIFGTPEYMSPEQARGETLDARSDVYSAAVVLWHCLLGRSPFRGKTVRETLTKVFSDEPPSPTAERPGVDIPTALTDALLAALIKDRAKRTQDAATFLAELQRLSTKSAPLSAPPQYAPTPGILPDGSAPETLADDEHSNPGLRRPRIKTELERPVAEGESSSARGAGSDLPPELSKEPVDSTLVASSTGFSEAPTAPLVSTTTPPGDSDTNVFTSSMPASVEAHVAERTTSTGEKPEKAPLVVTRKVPLPSANDDDGAEEALADSRRQRRVTVLAFAALIVVGVALVLVVAFSGEGEVVKPPEQPTTPVVVDLAAPAPRGFVKNRAASDAHHERAKNLVAHASELSTEDEKHAAREQALLAFTDAIRADPENFSAHFGYATLLLQAKRLEEARAHIARCLVLDPSNSIRYTPFLTVVDAEIAKLRATDAGAP